jgi:2-(1,2-epoxy-1,2-dihydrophenyl)acetyl-CoA isomerase
MTQTDIHPAGPVKSNGAAPLDGEAPLILVSREGGIAWLTLNRPDAANSIDAPLAKAFRTAIASLDADASVRVLVLSGAGRMFCAGGDLTTFAGQGDGAARYVEGLIHDLHAGLEQLASFHAPIVAAVHGAAAGAGLGLAMAADIVLADAGSRFVMAYTRAGLTPDGGTSWMLPRLVGMRRALELTLTNRTLSAREALELGLVTEVTTETALTARARTVALELAAGPTAAYATARRLIRSASENDYAVQLDQEARSIVASFNTADGLEGVRAFRERRAPVFPGARP